jgi:LytR cell envelope-related transcriptional attenuator
LLRTADGELGGAALLALQPGDDGGSVLVIPAAMQVDDEGTPVALVTAYARDGATRVQALVEQATTFAVQDVLEVERSRWETLLGPVGPLDVEIEAPVEEWEVGTATIAPEDLGRFLVAQESDQTKLSQALRQEAFWQAWLERVADQGDEAIAGERDSGLGRFVRGLARAPEVDSLAVSVTLGETGEEFMIDETLASEQLARSVPFPQSPAPGVRPRIRVLNGTTDRSLTAQAADLLVREGAEIAISGNAGSFDAPTTRILYSDETLRSTATEYQDALGIGVVEIDPSGQDAAAVDESERIDITIILGADAPEAIQEVGQAG